MQFLVRSFCGLCVSALLAGASASPNVCPTDALLAVTGLVKPNRSNGSFSFDEKDFLKLQTAKLVTTTTWTPKSEFVGPELATVLRAANASPKATELRFFAIDSYKITIPIADVAKYRPVMAHTQNGMRLTIPTRGPIFLVYPRDQHPELVKIEGQAQFVWMVCKIEVR